MIVSGILSTSAISAEHKPIVLKNILLCDTKEQVIEILDGLARKKHIQETINEINEREEIPACGLVGKIPVIDAEKQGTYEAGGKDKEIWKLTIISPRSGPTDQYTWVEDKAEKI